jgi:hypothetical protein
MIASFNYKNRQNEICVRETGGHRKAKKVDGSAEVCGEYHQDIYWVIEGVSIALPGQAF